MTKKLMLALMLLVATASINAAQATDGMSQVKTQKPVSEMDIQPPRGGWDGNNLRISATSSSKILPVQNQKPVAETGYMPPGGWDSNNLRISVTHCSKLLPSNSK